MGLLDHTIGVVVRTESKASQELIDACPTLRVIGRPGAGYDTVDIAAANHRKIPVVFAPVGGFAVAEGALALIMTLVKRIPLCDRAVKHDHWSYRYESYTGDMTESTLGIVGLGRIGAHLAKLVQPFEMTVLGCDPILDRAAAAKLGVELVDLDELLARSNYVSLHVPLDDTTRGLINRETIERMKNGAILVNTSRGGVVESLDAVAEGLESGKLAFVGLDVFPSEPPNTAHRIFEHPHCVCAPHMLGVSKLAMDRICRTMAQGVIDVLNDRRPQYCVNPEVFQ